MITTRTANAKEKNWCRQGHIDDAVARYILAKELVHNSDATTYLGAIDEVIDTDAYDIFRHRDVDLLAHLLHNRCWIEVEVKADGYKEIRESDGSMHKYIFVETVSNDVRGTMGWLHTSSANYFIYYFIQMDKYIIIDADYLRAYVEYNKQHLQHKTSQTYARDNKTVLYRSHGYLVDVYELNLPIFTPYHCNKYEAAKAQMIREGLLDKDDPDQLF